MDLLTILKPYIDVNYKKFQEKICHTNYIILGVKVPILRKISKDLLKDDNILNYNFTKYFEFILLEGLIIANLNININDLLKLIKKYLVKIDNWAICDIFCSELKLCKNNQELFLNFLDSIKHIKKEYYQRFYIVILLNYYINDNYIDYVLQEMLNLQNNGYYTKMTILAIAWCYSVCLVKYYDKTFKFLYTNKKIIMPSILKKTISKANDSYRLSKSQKQELKSLK